MFLIAEIFILEIVWLSVFICGPKFFKKINGMNSFSLGTAGMELTY